jgi:hypothetical protein
MGELNKLQQDFAAAVLAAGDTLPAALTRKGGVTPHRRFRIYRNNVYASLIDVVQSRFPVVSRLVGDEFFRAMARVYVQKEPPRSAVLLCYGESFPSFVTDFEPAGSVPYLPDIAALEWAWHEAYHAADAAPLPLEELAAVVAQASDAVLKLHPSLGLVSSDFPIVTIYELHAEASEPPQTKLEAKGEDALVLRPQLDVEIRRLPAGAVSFVKTLWAGCSIEEATEAALGCAPNFDLEANLLGLMTSGAIVGVDARRVRSLNKVLPN